MHPPFSNFIFSKSSCAPTCKFSERSDQQFLRKLTFFVKKWHFKKMHFLVKISTLGKASALRFSPAFSASSFLVVCQILAPKLFSMLRNVCFFDRKWSKIEFKKCSKSRKLRDFWNLLLWKSLVNFSQTQLSNLVSKQLWLLEQSNFAYNRGVQSEFFHFFRKIKISMHPPFSNFIFSKSSCAPTCKFSDRSDQQFLRKLTFFVKKWHFKKMHFLVKISTLGKASALRFSPAFSASSFLVVCQILAPKLFSMLRNVCFFDRKWSKIEFKKCSKSRKLRDFWNLLLWKSLVNFSQTQLSNLVSKQLWLLEQSNFAYNRGVQSEFFHFFKKIKISMYPPFSNFIFSKSSCAPTCKFSERSDQQFLRKLTFFVKKWHFKKCIFWSKSQHSVKLAPCGFHQRFQRPLF